MAIRVKLALAILYCSCHLAACAPSLISENAIDTGGPADENPDVDETVRRVEDILKANPDLPRLSKDDILLLLNNITAEDELNAGDGNFREDFRKAAPETTAPKKDARAIMVVLPYKPEDGDMEELYTRPPIVKMMTTETLPRLYKETDGKYRNHKYTQKTKTDALHAALTEAPNAQFWQGQAQKVMSDLDSRNHRIPTSDIPVESGKFKKMPSAPSGFHHKLEIPEIVKVKATAVDDSRQSESGIIVPTLQENGVVKTAPAPIEGLEYLINSMTQYKDAPEKMYPVYQGGVATSDMHDIMESFGLSGTVDSLGLNPINDQISLESSPYAAFKPLPIGKVSSGAEMDSKDISEMLAEFGISDSDVRDSKFNAEESIIQVPASTDVRQPTASELIDADMFPAGMASMLTDMGLAAKRGRKLSNPKVETSEDIRAESSQRTDFLSAGPDPLSVDEAGGIDEQTHNDISKRQQSINTTIEITKETSSVAPPETTTAVELKEGPSIADLENSFGASPADNDPSEAELPPPRKNGFYYMLDWNSFLEVGDGATKVNIRFDPKLGDPQRFISVSVP